MLPSIVFNQLFQLEKNLAGMLGIASLPAHSRLTAVPASCLLLLVSREGKELVRAFLGLLLVKGGIPRYLYTGSHYRSMHRIHHIRIGFWLPSSSGKSAQSLSQPRPATLW